jgi:hypothetical protein
VCDDAPRVVPTRDASVRAWSEAKTNRGAWIFPFVAAGSAAYTKINNKFALLFKPTNSDRISATSADR